MQKDLSIYWLPQQQVQVITGIVIVESHSGLTLKMGPEQLLSKAIHIDCVEVKFRLDDFVSLLNP